MQAELAQAEADLAEAEAALAQGQADRDDQRQRVANTVADMYSEGDPDLIAFSSMLDAVSAEDLTRRDGVRDVIVGPGVEGVRPAQGRRGAPRGARAPGLRGARAR